MEKIIKIQAASTWFKRNKKPKTNTKKAYGIALGQYTPHLRAKLESQKTWTVMNTMEYLIGLIKGIRALPFKYDEETE